MSEVGDNSNPQLRSIVDRIVRLETEKRDRSEDIAEVYKEAKSGGIDVKALRLVIRHEMEDEDKRKDRERIQEEADLMLAAIGPLGAAAVGR